MHQASVTEEKKEESRSLGPMVRLLLILVLFSRALQADLLSFRTLGATLLTVAYVGAILGMAGFVAVLWRKALKEPDTEEPSPVSEAPRRVHGLFSEPWYELPAVFCMIVVGINYASSLLAAPPESTMSRWFVALLGFSVLVGIIGQFGNGSSRNQSGRGTWREPRDEPPPTGPLSDPVFLATLVTFSVLMLASEGVARIDSQPSSVAAWFSLVAAIGAAAFVAFALISRLTRKPEATR